jgi:hypothetical protein
MLYSYRVWKQSVGRRGKPSVLPTFHPRFPYSCIGFSSPGSSTHHGIVEQHAVSVSSLSDLGAHSRFIVVLGARIFLLDPCYFIIWMDGISVICTTKCSWAWSVWLDPRRSEAKS